MIARHLPLITNRIPFTLNPPPELPSLTTRNDFVIGEPLVTPSNSNPSTLPDTASSLKYSASVVFFGAQKEMATRKEGKGKKVEEKEVQEEGNGAEEIVVLIPKPSGEPGRPRSGGYSLDEVLGVWGAETLSKVTVRLPTRRDFLTIVSRYFRRPLSKTLRTRTSTPALVMPSKVSKKSTRSAK